MEENISHAIGMTFCVFLFVFALSTAVMRYNSMNDTAETLISINIVNRRGTAVDAQLEATDIKRQADYGEIALTILNMEDNITKSTGNNLYTVEVDRLSNPDITIKYTPPSGDDSGYMTMKVDSIELKYYSSDMAGLSPALLGTNDFLENVELYFGVDAKYNVSYTENKIIYKEI